MMKSLPLVIAVSISLYLYVLTDTEDRSRCSSDQQQTIKASDDHEIRTYKMLSAGQNSAFSPVGMLPAYGMLLLGAVGRTIHEIKSALGINITITPVFHLLCKRYLDYFTMPTSGMSNVVVLSRIMVPKGFQVLDSYRIALREFYKCDVEEADFGGPESGSLQKLANSWITRATRGSIRNMMEWPIDKSTEILILNAAYFKGSWQTPFVGGNTRLQEFYTTPEKTKDIAMMHMPIAYANFANDPELDCKAVELTYSGGKFSILFILPNKRDGLRNLDARLTRARLNNLSKMLRPTKVCLKLPRFRVDESYDFKEIMKKIGMRNIFGPMSDWRKISPAMIGSRGEAIHKVVLAVDEKGSMNIGKKARPVHNSTSLVSQTCLVDIPVFNADHPFAFVIREKRTSLIMFMGRVWNPQ